MKNLEELKTEIEHARRRLDDAMGSDCEDEQCYRLSLELDGLIEAYIAAEDEIQVSGVLPKDLKKIQRDDQHQ